MFCRRIISFVCVFVAAVIATNTSDTNSNRESDPEVTVYHLKNYNPWMGIIRFVVKSVVSFIKASLVRGQPGDQPGVSQPLPGPPAEGRTPAPADSGATRATQPHSSSHSSGHTTPASAACHAPTPGDAAISQLRTLSGKEKNRRLIEAAKKGSVEELQLLLAAGADVGARDDVWEGRTALHWAAVEGRVTAVGCLLAAGADVAATNSWGHTPLLFAAWSGHAAVVAQLAAAGADPDARDQWGRAPLHWAAVFGHAQAAAALLEAGADRGALADSGRTPLDIARYYNRQQLVDMLRSS